MAEQRILYAKENYSELDGFLAESNVKKILLVCDNAIRFLKIDDYFNDLEAYSGIKVVRFTDFMPNPQYESVVKGVELFRLESCDMIIAVGGGSAIDVAKCIKLYSNMDSSRNYLTQEIVPNNIDFLAVPTTAGTGSEATRYAVIYYNGEKQSVADKSCIPPAVLMDSSVLKTLPLYQKKSTMMDALCHAIESFWSVNSTEESEQYSEQAIKMILANKDTYLNNTDYGNENMLKAANIAGKAINITQTTAGHAMCYKLTSLYGIAHGHAAALCVSELFPYMFEHTEDTVDPRGKKYLESTFEKIAKAFSCSNVNDAIIKYQKLLRWLDFEAVSIKTADDISILKTSVNPTRLKNNPVRLDQAQIEILYTRILHV